MSGILTVAIEDLLGLRRVELARVEFKSSWDEKTTGPQVLRTICAFANDLHNLNGGYIILGVAEENGVAKRPVMGIAAQDIDRIQKWIRGQCKRMEPEYQPVPSPERIDGCDVLVLWAPGSEIRPHYVAEGKGETRKYFVRIGSESVDAEKNGVLQQLIEMTALVPFDDRRALTARLEDLRESKVREYLKEIGSGLLEEKEPRVIYRNMADHVPRG